MSTIQGNALTNASTIRALGDVLRQEKATDDVDMQDVRGTTEKATRISPAATGVTGEPWTQDVPTLSALPQVEKIHVSAQEMAAAGDLADQYNAALDQAAATTSAASLSDIGDNEGNGLSLFDAIGVSMKADLTNVSEDHLAGRDWFMSARKIYDGTVQMYKRAQDEEWKKHQQQQQAICFLFLLIAVFAPHILTHLADLIKNRASQDFKAMHQGAPEFIKKQLLGANAHLTKDEQKTLDAANSALSDLGDLAGMLSGFLAFMSPDRPLYGIMGLQLTEEKLQSLKRDDPNMKSLLEKPPATAYQDLSKLMASINEQTANSGL
jgi:hypothetical protein